MECRKCNGPTGCGDFFLATRKYRYSETAKAIEKIKKGIKPLIDFDEVCNNPILPNNTIGRFCKDNPELAFHTGFELAALQCGELLAKAQDDDK